MISNKHNTKVQFFFRKLSDGLFLEACNDVAKDFPDIQFDDVLLDRACLHVCSKEFI